MNEVPASLPRAAPWRRELVLAAALIGFGLLVLPFAIYVVGRQLLGEYGADSGAMALAESIWLDLLALRSPAWLLVLSPYVIVQVVRWVWGLWRPKRL
jgi:hypothetical protein